MVQFSQDEHLHPDPPPIPLLAFFLRYPNPFARHVLSVDVLSRHITSSGRIYTTRLILKRGILPKWASKWLPVAGASGGRGLDAWVLEDSVIDPPGWEEAAGMAVKAGKRYARLQYKQGNLNHRKFMHVMEGGEIRSGENGTTLHSTTAEIRSDFGGRWSSMVRNRIEAYGAGKFEVNTEKARKGMSWIMNLLRTRQHLPNGEMSLLPGFAETEPETAEYRARWKRDSRDKQGDGG